MNHGRDLKKKRLEKGLSQEDVALILHWPKSKVSKIENGLQHIYLDDYLAYMAALEARKVTFIIPNFKDYAQVGG